MNDKPDRKEDRAPITDEHELIREQYEKGQADSREHAVASLAAGFGSKQPASPLIPEPTETPPDAADQHEAVQQLKRLHGRDTGEES